MNQISKIQAQLKLFVTRSAESKSMFYKTGIGEYSEHDQFMGITIPNLRKIARNFPNLALNEIQVLLTSKFNEERLLALFILVTQYQKSENTAKEKLCQFYINNLQYVNNWNLVDASAHLILGAHLVNKDKEMLVVLAKSAIMWERRVSIVATWCFIRRSELEWTFKIAKLLLCDNQDLIHKAVGWMLREAGKKDQDQLIEFLDQYAGQMPRTALRYSIEKFPEPTRKHYLNGWWGKSIKTTPD